LKVHFTENLKVAYVGDGIGANVLRMKVIKVQNILEEL
jgi:hypothetical protein